MDTVRNNCYLAIKLFFKQIFASIKTKLLLHSLLLYLIHKNKDFSFPEHEFIMFWFITGHVFYDCHYGFNIIDVVHIARHKSNVGVLTYVLRSLWTLFSIAQKITFIWNNVVNAFTVVFVVMNIFYISISKESVQEKFQHNKNVHTNNTWLLLLCS